MKYVTMLEVQSDREIQELLADRCNRMILESIKTVPKSTGQICIECNIPPSTAYRKMQKLFDCKTIRRIGTINESGKREIFYRSNFFMLKDILNW